MTVQDVVEVVRAAFAEGAAEFVYFNTGYLGSEDGGIAFLEPYIRARQAPFRHAGRGAAAPAEDQSLDRPDVRHGRRRLELQRRDPRRRAILRTHCAGRVRYIGRERYYDALAHAAAIFPSGTVWSDLVVGLEPAESTVRGIDTLTAIGVLPVLSPFRPRTELQLRDHPPPEVDEVVPIYAHLFHAARDAKINLGWVRDLSFAITPLEARFFAGDDARMAVVLQHFYRSQLGISRRAISRACGAACACARSATRSIPLTFEPSTDRPSCPDAAPATTTKSSSTRRPLWLILLGRSQQIGAGRGRRRALLVVVSLPPAERV